MAEIESLVDVAGILIRLNLIIVMNAKGTVPYRTSNVT